MFDLIRSQRRDLSDLMNHLWDMENGTQARPAGYLPPVDIVESESEFRLAVECAGLEKESLNVTLEGNTLTIAGEKKQCEESKNHFVSRERRFGKFSRSFTIPVRVESGKIEARYENGVLDVRLPKAQEAQPQRIQIQS